MAPDSQSPVRGAQTLATDARPTASTHGAGQAGARLTPAEPSHTTHEDFDTLLGAVKSRLRNVVGNTMPAADVAATDTHMQAPMQVPMQAHMQAPTQAQMQAQMPPQIRVQVLECVQALEQLQDLLTHERARQGSAAECAAQVQAQLTHALADLARSRSEGRRAQHRTLHDALTLLPNRSFFRQCLDRALMEHAVAPRPIAVLYLDLDGMKQINDRHGHCVGDRLLQVVASRLSGAVRGADTVSRQGGDEFALLLLPPPEREHLAALAEKLFDTVAAPVQLGEIQLTVRASIGIALTPHDGCTADTLLHHADVAMYQAKRQQSRYVFFDAMTAA